MGPAKTISQEAFDEAVQGNIDDFDMEPEEAVQAAVEEFEIQKVDLSGINKTFYKGRKEHPVLGVIARIQAEVDRKDAGSLVNSLTEVTDILNSKEGDESTVGEALAVTSLKGMVPTLLKAVGDFKGNEAVVLACLSVISVQPPPLPLPSRLSLSELCLFLSDTHHSTTRHRLNAADHGWPWLCAPLPPPYRWLCRASQGLATLLVTDPHREAYHKQRGSAVMVSLLKDSVKGPVATAALSTAAQACFKNEDNKGSFIVEGGDDMILAAIRESNAEAPALIAACTALRSITVADDDRPCLTSGAFKNAREIAGKGAAADLLAVLRKAKEDVSPLAAAAACSALRRITVTDEICKDVADQQGVELLLDSIQTYLDNAAVARTGMSVLRQLANSDANKGLIIQRGALSAIQTVCKSGNAGSCEQALGLIVGLTLRNPTGASAAVEAGCIDTIVTVMSALPSEQWVQRQGCMAIRNLVARNPEHKDDLLGKGAEPLLRKAQSRHPQACKDVGGAALRDLGFDDYDLGIPAKQ